MQKAKVTIEFKIHKATTKKEMVNVNVKKLAVGPIIPPYVKPVKEKPAVTVKEVQP